MITVYNVALSSRIGKPWLQEERERWGMRITPTIDSVIFLRRRRIAMVEKSCQKYLSYGWEKEK
jgi:hypothetical protein